jgi:hypothetical protein
MLNKPNRKFVSWMVMAQKEVEDVYINEVRKQKKKKNV